MNERINYPTNQPTNQPTNLPTNHLLNSSCGVTRALIIHVNKIFLRITLKSVECRGSKGQLKYELQEVRTGSRQGRGTMGYILHMRTILEKRRKFNIDIEICFSVNPSTVSNMGNCGICLESLNFHILYFFRLLGNSLYLQCCLLCGFHCPFQFFCSFSGP